jgi:hypothetical protein
LFPFNVPHVDADIGLSGISPASVPNVLGQPGVGQLRYLREEEKLARDVYQTLYQR